MPPPSLSLRLRPRTPPSPTPEDIFSSSLSILSPVRPLSLFPFTTLSAELDHVLISFLHVQDAPQTSHGDPGSALIYASPLYGDIELRIPQHPDEEGGRQLFAHYLWSAGIVVADYIERARWRGLEEGEKEEGEKEEGEEGTWWDVRGCRVLELGAGTALPSLIAARSGARSVSITDHPSSPALASGAIRENVVRNLIAPIPSFSNSDSPTSTNNTDHNTAVAPAKCNAKITILPHIWGAVSSPSAICQRHGFDKIIVADCLWMPSQHENLLRTIEHFLRRPPASSSDDQDNNDDGDISDVGDNRARLGRRRKRSQIRPCALVVAGFHTGRAIAAGFFQTATTASLSSPSTTTADEVQGENEVSFVAKATSKERKIKGVEAGDGRLKLEHIYELHISTGRTREFCEEERPGEGKEESRRWCVVGVLTSSASPECNWESEGMEVESEGGDGDRAKEEGSATATLSVDEVGWIR